MNTRTFQWLIRREAWEHKGMLTWVPLVIAAFMIVAVLGVTIAGHNASIEVDGQMLSVGNATVQLNDRQIQALAEGIAGASPVGGSVIYVSLAFMVFSYSLGALYNERRDRSILFWQSLPVSDTATVISKAAFALIGIPLLVIVVELVTSLVIVAIAMAALATKGINLFPLVLSNPQFWLGPLKVLSMLPVYALWALPTVGWLLLVSAWARSKVFLWAVGVPLGALVMALWVENGLRQPVNAHWLIEKIISRLLTGVMPGTWLMAGGLVQRAGNIEGAAHAGGRGASLDRFYHDSWATLGTPELILGALAGIAMLAAAIWLRRRREEG